MRACVTTELDREAAGQTASAKTTASMTGAAAAH